ncbi:hypothetical protein [Methylobacterium sp.]|jgi:hypothetical protein|uniref:hypothetical protein n=1 Tax=Methylobacterium sp. TaxID=409 RepID=UPI002612E598|nr:hypothetical protein [Methylobacterium sp.]MDB5646386.1 hypothetical protein [Methylobacterium sp.]
MKPNRRIALLTEPLLARNPDLAIIDNCIWVKPVHHFGRCILIQMDDDHCFRLEWKIPCLFVPFAHPVQYPDWITHSIERSSIVRWVDYHPMHKSLTRKGEHAYMNWGQTYWNYADPTVPEDFIYQIEATLRLLRSLDTMEKCVAFLHMNFLRTYQNVRDWTMFAHLGLGHIGPARAHWISVRQDYLAGLVEHPETPLQRRTSRFCELDEPLVTRDRRGLATLLHQWEFENITTLKLETVWEQSSFPLQDGL